MSFGFGTTANTQSSAGTLFGAPATSTTTGFGSSANTNAAGTLFGANTANSSAAGTLFGGSATTSTPASTGFGGFGATSTAPATGGFGGFGATSQPATSTAGTTGFGGFGNTTATSTAGTTGFGGFGATSTAPAAGGFGGFGTTPATSTAGTTGFGGFGATPATSTAGTTGFGGFGTTPATSTAGTTTFGGFGANTNATKPGGFGAATTTFGAKPATGFGTQPTTGFGAQPTTGFGTQPTTGFGMQQQPQQPAPVQEKVWQDLALIRAHFDPTSPLCQFRHYFYNMVPTNEVHLYVRPPNQDEQLWNEAVRKNPDPSNLVPVMAVGFDDILKRMEIQSKQVELHQEKLKETEERLKTAQRQYMLGTLVKLEEHKRRHIYLTQRLLRLLRYSQVLRYKGFPLTADEEQSINELNQLASDANNPEQLNAKMISLWNQLQAIKAKRHNEEQGKVEVWRTVNEEDTRVIAKVLSDYQQGIKHITTILKEDTKDLETIESGLRGKRKSSEDYIS